MRWRIDVLKRHPRIVLRAYMTYSWVSEPVPPNVVRECPEELIIVSGEVNLGEPVGDRAIYDASRQPPVKRWPE